jgi:hypothetical protein
MDDKQTLLELAKIVSSVVELQIKQAKATSILVARLDVQAEVDAAQNLADDSESQLLRSLRRSIQSTIDQLSKARS